MFIFKRAFPREILFTTHNPSFTRNLRDTLLLRHEMQEEYEKNNVKSIHLVDTPESEMLSKVD